MKWLLAILAALAGVFGMKWKAEQAGREKDKREAAEAQRDTLVNAQNAQAQAREEGQQEADDAKAHARRADFSDRIGL